MADGLRSLILYVQSFEQNLMDKVEDVMQDVALDGESQMKAHLLTAETDWGRARVAGEVPGPAGPSREHAGRYETGDMYNKITSEVTHPSRNVIEARWGWQDADYQDYFGYQDLGTARITAAEAGQFSLDRAEDILRGRLNALNN